jgi:hypothetical protein
VLSLGAKPGYNILILSQKTCEFYVYPKFLARGEHARDMCASGMHAVSWVTSVNPDVCKLNGQGKP